MIGRVSVRVLPDTDDFRRKAKSDLDKIENKLSPIKIPTKLDMSGASREFLTELQKINQRNRNSNARKIRFHSTISTDGMREEITRAIRALEARTAGRPVKFKADVTASVTATEIDRESLKNVQRELEKWRDDNSPLEIDVTLNWVAGSSSYINQRLNYLTRPRTVHILPMLDKIQTAKVATALAALSGLRFVSSTLTNITDLFKNLDKNVTLIGSLALAIAGLSGWALSATANLASLSSSLAQIGPAALALPGIFMGFGLGLGATIAVLKDFNAVLPNIGKNFTDLQDRMSESFWAVARGPMANMLDILLPQLNEGLETTAASLGTWFGALSDSMAKHLNGVMVPAFQDLAASIDIASRGTDAYTSIIATLGTTGAGYLPQLAQWFVDISTKFDNFLSAAAQDGRLQGWIDQGIYNLGQLGGVLFNLGGILSGVARAATAAGATTLGTLNDKLQRMHEIVDSPSFQTGLTNAFTGAQMAMDNIANIAGPSVTRAFENIANTALTVLPLAGTAIGTLFAAIGDVLASPEFSAGLTAMFAGIANAVRTLQPAIVALAPAFGALGETFGVLATSFAPLLATVLGALGQAFTALAPTIQVIVQTLSGALLGVLTAIAPLFVTVANVVGSVLLAAFTALQPVLPILADLFTQIATVLGEFATAALPVLAPLLTTLATAFVQILAAVAPLLPVLLELVVAVLTPLLPIITQIVTALVGILVPAIEALIPVITQIVEAFAALVNFLMPVLAPALSLLATLLTDTVGTAIDGVVNVVTGAFDIIQGAWNIFSGLFSGDWSQMWNGVKQVASGIWDVLKGAFEILVTVGILGVARKGLAALKGFWDNIWNAIKTAATSAWTGLRTAWDNFLTALRTAPSNALSAIRRLFSEAWDSIRTTATYAWTLVKSAFTTGVSNVLSTVRALPGQVRSALGNLGSTLVSAGQSLIRGFINGITSMIGSVRSTLSDLTSRLTSWKGPESLDRVLLVNAGQLVIGGFVKGLESRYGEVRKSLQGLTREVGNWDVEGPNVGSLGSRISGIVDGSDVEGVQVRVLQYNAAPNNSIDSFEDLFTAANRSRMVAW
ncbi:phage tail protein [Kineococcus esterisolvens]|uniref:phage tail protein n=1 Tax=unclassified Kineococcus TaxID=2621656 RepID=UPI003D7D9781